MSRDRRPDSLDDALPGVRLSDAQSRLLDELERRRGELRALGGDASPLERARTRLRIAELLLELGRGAEAWEQARPLVDELVALEAWESAVEALRVLYGCEQPQSIAALGQGVWLAVTWPVDPALTVDLLHRIVDETPADSDGAAVAAAAAHYVVHLRAEGRQREDLGLVTNQVLVDVARRHRGIEGEEMVNTWMEVLGLNDPDELLSMLGQVVEAMVDGHWWFDRDAIRARLPVD